jgi:hypothetical protein
VGSVDPAAIRDKLLLDGDAAPLQRDGDRSLHGHAGEFVDRSLGREG